MFRAAHPIQLRKFRNRNTQLHIETLERRELLSGTPPTVTKVEVGSTAWSSAFVQFLNPSNPEAIGYAVPVGSAAQSATLTWDNIDRIALTFSKDVNVDAADLSLSGVNTAAYHFADFHYDPLTRVAVWQLSAPLDRDRFRIDLDANGAHPVKDLDGNVLDGEWTNNVSTISGNGTAGGDFEFNFNVLPTDVNNTANINSLDYVYIRQLDGKTTASSGYIAKRDIDGNGTINSVDWQKALDRALQVLPTGTPAGTSNDAPTTSGLNLVKITDASVDVAISLLSGFADNENGASGLTYSIVSNSNPALFDSAAINSPSKSLVVNAANGVTGRASLVVRAMDAGGLTVDTTVTIDINRDNEPPEIHNFSISTVRPGTFLVSGDVVDDDDDVANFMVDFWNVFTVRSVVDQYGHFEFAITLTPSTWGTELAIVQDSHGLASDVYAHDIYML